MIWHDMTWYKGRGMKLRFLWYLMPARAREQAAKKPGCAIRLPSHLHIIEYHLHIIHIIRYLVLISVFSYSCIMSYIMWYHVISWFMISHDISRYHSLCSGGLGRGRGHDIMWYHMISCRVDGVECEVRIWRYIMLYHYYIMCRYHVPISSRTRDEIDMIWHGAPKKMR